MGVAIGWAGGFEHLLWRAPHTNCYANEILDTKCDSNRAVVGTRKFKLTHYEARVRVETKSNSTIQLKTMISLNNISMRYGARVLFEDVTTTFMAGRRVARTRPHGAGKSTLMKILTGEIEPTKGNVSRPKKIGVLRQDQFAFDEFRVIYTGIMGHAPLWEGLQEHGMLYAQPYD